MVERRTGEAVQRQNVWGAGVRDEAALRSDLPSVSGTAQCSRPRIVKLLASTKCDLGSLAVTIMTYAF